MLNREIVINAINGEFSEFKKNVETYLKNKIANNPQVKSVSSEETRLNQISKTFREIQQK